VRVPETLLDDDPREAAARVRRDGGGLEGKAAAVDGDQAAALRERQGSEIRRVHHGWVPPAFVGTTRGRASW
jgi:hypothetical protein